MSSSLRQALSSRFVRAALPFLIASPVLAGEYHFGATLACTDCHTMHFSQTHNWDGSTPVSPTPEPDGNWLGASGPNTYLLKLPESQLCLACHDGQTFAPDVYGANTGAPYVRQAGALPTGQAPYEQWKGHTLNQLLPAPGGSANLRLQCVTCHAHHGSANYRNLDGTATPISYAVGTNNLARDVFVRSSAVGAIPTNYAVDNVDFNEPGANASAMGRFCRGCHPDFHGGAYDSNMYDGLPGTGAWLRHPTAGVNIGAIGGEHSILAAFAAHPYRVKVMSPTGDWGTPGVIFATPPTNLTPSCMSCHKAHGNQNPFGLIFLEGTGPVNEEGDANGNAAAPALRITSLCGQCHVQ
jgi:hypothetical protein